MWALPNRPGVAFNWAGNTKVSANSEQFTARLDHMLGEKQKILGRYSIWKAGPRTISSYNGLIVQDQEHIPGLPADPTGCFGRCLLFLPQPIADFRFSYMRFGYDRRPGTQGQDLTALGLPANLTFRYQRSPGMFPMLSLQVSPFFGVVV